MKKIKLPKIGKNQSNNLDDKLNIPGGALGLLPYVTLNDFRVAELSGCREIITYEDNMLRVAVRGGVLTVYGDGLTLRSYYGAEIAVAGRLDSVEFVRDRVSTKDNGDKNDDRVD